MKDIDASLHKLPPQNLEAEQSVLGGILLDNPALNTLGAFKADEVSLTDVARNVPEAQRIFDRAGFR